MDARAKRGHDELFAMRLVLHCSLRSCPRRAAHYAAAAGNCGAVSSQHGSAETRANHRARSVGRDRQVALRGIKQRGRDREVGERRLLADKVGLFRQMGIEHRRFLVEAGECLGDDRLVGRTQVQQLLHQPFDDRGSQASLPQCARCQHCQRTISRGCGRRPAKAYWAILLAIYCMIATDFPSVKSPSTSVGVRPVGLSAKYSGVCGRLWSSRRTRARAESADVGDRADLPGVGRRRESIKLHDRLLTVWRLA